MALTFDQIAKALRANGGFITKTANALNVTPGAISKRIKENPELQKVKQAVADEALDFAEYQLGQQIKKGNLTAIIFFLKCKGKERGYVENTQLDIKVSDRNFDLVFHDYHVDSKQEDSIGFRKLPNVNIQTPMPPVRSPKKS